MALEFSERLKRANQRLKAAGLGVALVQNHNRLYIQATLPPKLTSKRQEPHQQKLATGKPCNGAGLDAAEKLAKTVAGELIAGNFSWEHWGQRLAQRNRRAGTVAEWIEAFAQVHRPQVKASTWRAGYSSILGQLPQDAPLTEDVLRAAILSKPEASAQRKRFAITLGKLARFAGLDCDLSSISGSYSHKSLSPRDLPSDELIVQTWQSIKQPGWRWVFGMMATYGLRNHEVWYLDLEAWQGDGGGLHVFGAKTDAHDTWPFHPEWVEAFGLREVVWPFETVYSEPHRYGARVTYEAARNWPFSAYNLRHAWAVRTLLYGLPDSVSARMMGHSVGVHQRTYQHWLGQAHSQAAVDRVLGRGDRPQPPAL